MQQLTDKQKVFLSTSLLFLKLGAVAALVFLDLSAPVEVVMVTILVIVILAIEFSYTRSVWNGANQWKTIIGIASLALSVFTLYPLILVYAGQPDPNGYLFGTIIVALLGDAALDTYRIWRS